MKEFFSTVRLTWAQIEVITRLLRGGKFHPTIDPPTQPADVNTIVEVPVKIKAQGKDNAGIAEEIIIGDKKNPRAEIITHFTELTSSPWSEIGKFIIERGWETLAIWISSIASIYGLFYVLAYNFKESNMTLDWFHHIELVLLSAIPPIVDLCYAGAWRKKNAFTAEQNNLQYNNNQNNIGKSTILGTPIR